MTEELTVLLSRMAVLIQKNAASLLVLPPEISVGTGTPDRIADHRGGVAVIQGVLARSHHKVVFFGRTSSGKSSAINALLGSRVLPTGQTYLFYSSDVQYAMLFRCFSGLGHTTSCFVNVRGTQAPTPSVLVPAGSDADEDTVVEIDAG